jgi:hypothetical protein
MWCKLLRDLHVETAFRIFDDSAMPFGLAQNALSFIRTACPQIILS